MTAAIVDQLRAAGIYPNQGPRWFGAGAPPFMCIHDASSDATTEEIALLANER